MTGEHHGQCRGLTRRPKLLWKERSMSPATDDYIDMRIGDVHKGTEHDGAYIVLLEEQGGDRRLPIWIGHAEAAWLALRLEGEHPARPTTYDLTAALLRQVGGLLREVRVNRLIEGTFYASAVLDGPSGPAELDARPSDALNLALVAGAPIRVDAAVLNQALMEASGEPPWPRAGLQGSRGARAIVEELLAPPDPPESESSGR
jgi:bifunctional DNase/RNase